MSKDWASSAISPLAAHSHGTRLSARHLARLRGQLLDASHRAAGQKERDDEGDAGRREPGIDDRLVDARQVDVSLPGRLGDDDGDARTRGVFQRAARLRDVGSGSGGCVERHLRVDGVAQTLDDGLEAPRSDEAHRVAAGALFAAPRHERRLGRGAQREVRHVTADELRELGARRVEKGDGVLPEPFAVRGREHQLVQVERLPLLGDDARERQASLVVERAGLEPDERAVDELPRLARARHELAVALGLPADLGNDAIARAAHLLVESLRLALAAVLAHEVPEPRDREGRDEAEGQDEPGVETHGRTSVAFFPSLARRAR